MYQNIVVGTDGSESAGIAVDHALMLAAAGGGTVHVVHAYQDVAMSVAAVASSTGGPGVDLQRLNDSLQEHGSAVCAAVAEKAAAAGVAMKSHIEVGDPADCLLRVAGEVGADLLVVGNRGMSGLKRFVLGSVPNRVSHHAPCTLLIVNTTR